MKLRGRSLHDFNFLQDKNASLMYKFLHVLHFIHLAQNTGLMEESYIYDNCTMLLVYYVIFPKYYSFYFAVVISTIYHSNQRYRKENSALK